MKNISYFFCILVVFFIIWKPANAQENIKLNLKTIVLEKNLKKYWEKMKATEEGEEILWELENFVFNKNINTQKLTKVKIVSLKYKNKFEDLEQLSKKWELYLNISIYLYYKSSLLILIQEQKENQDNNLRKDITQKLNTVNNTLLEKFQSMTEKEKDLYIWDIDFFEMVELIIALDKWEPQWYSNFITDLVILKKENSELEYLSKEQITDTYKKISLLEFYTSLITSPLSYEEIMSWNYVQNIIWYVSVLWEKRVKSLLTKSIEEKELSDIKNNLNFHIKNLDNIKSESQLENLIKSSNPYATNIWVYQKIMVIKYFQKNKIWNDKNTWAKETMIKMEKLLGVIGKKLSLDLSYDQSNYNVYVPIGWEEILNRVPSYEGVWLEINWIKFIPGDNYFVGTLRYELFWLEKSNFLDSYNNEFIIWYSTAPVKNGYTENSVVQVLGFIKDSSTWKKMAYSVSTMWMLTDLEMIYDPKRNTYFKSQEIIE